MTPTGPIVNRRVRWWRCGAVYIPSLQSWTGDTFRAHFQAAGLPHCFRWRWHRGGHLWDYDKGTGVRP